MKKLLLTILLAICVAVSFAQSDPAPSGGHSVTLQGNVRIVGGDTIRSVYQAGYGWMDIAGRSWVRRAGALKPTNGLQPITPDSIGLGGGLTQPASINLNGQYFELVGPNSIFSFNDATFHVGIGDATGAASFVDVAPNDFILSIQTASGKQFSFSADTSSGFQVRDDKFNAGLADFIHHTVTSGLQLAEIQDIDSIAHAKADSIHTAYIDISQQNNLTDTSAWSIATYNTTTHKFSAMYPSFLSFDGTQYNATDHPWEFSHNLTSDGRVTAMQGITAPSNDSYINNLHVFNRLYSRDMPENSVVDTDYIVTMPYGDSTLYKTKISDVILSDTSTIRSVANNVVYEHAFGGQSNMASPAGDTTLSPKLTKDVAIQWYNGSFRTANDPNGPLNDTLYKGSMIPAYWIQFHRLTGKRGLSIQNAVGSSSIIAAAQSVGKPTWDVTTPNNLTKIMMARIDSAHNAAIAIGLNPIFTGITWHQGENEALAVQSGTITGAQYYTGLINLVDTLRTWRKDPNFKLYVIALGTRNTAPSWGFDTIRNREYQAELAGYITIVNNEFQNFPAEGLMATNPYYTQLHAGQIGLNKLGGDVATAEVSGMPQFVLTPASSKIPSMAIPQSATLTTTPVNGAFEAYKNNLFASFGALQAATRYRVGVLPQNGIAPGAVFFGNSSRGLGSDSTYLNYDDTNHALQNGNGQLYFAGHRLLAYKAIGSNAKIALEEYGNTTPPSIINLLASRGTSNTAAAAVQSGDFIGQIAAYENYGTGAAAYNSNYAAGISFAARENATSTANGAGIDIFTTPIGTNSHIRAAYFSDAGGLYLNGNSVGQPISIPTRLYAKALTGDSTSAVFDGGTLPAGTFRNNTYYNYNRLNVYMNTNVSATLDATLGLNINTSNNKFVKFGTGPFTVGSSTGVVHATAGLFSYSNVVYGDMQAGTTGKLYGTGSGTTFSEIGLSPNFSFSGSTLNWIAPIIGTLPGRTIVADADYTQLATDYAIAYTTLTAPRTVTLIAIADKQTILVKDEAGTAATNNITINAPSGKTIDGASSKVISTNNGFVKLYYQLSSGNYFTY